MYKDSSKPDYLALNWETKHDQLWSEIKSDSSLGEYYPTQMFTESLITTFENEWDILPEGRNKAIHGNGAICPFTVDVSNGKMYIVNLVCNSALFINVSAVNTPTDMNYSYCVSIVYSISSYSCHGNYRISANSFRP